MRTPRNALLVVVGVGAEGHGQLNRLPVALDSQHGLIARAVLGGGLRQVVQSADFVVVHGGDDVSGLQTGDSGWAVGEQFEDRGAAGVLEWEGAHAHAALHAQGAAVAWHPAAAPALRRHAFAAVNVDSHTEDRVAVVISERD